MVEDLLGMIQAIGSIPNTEGKKGRERGRDRGRERRRGANKREALRLENNSRKNTVMEEHTDETPQCLPRQVPEQGWTNLPR